jgi:hypothetical protein
MSARASAALLVVSLCLMAADPPDDRVPPKAGKARGPNCDPDHGLPAAAVARLNIPRFGPGAFIAFSPDGRTLTACYHGDGPGFCRWEAAGWKKQRRVDDLRTIPPDDEHLLDVSYDATTCISATPDGVRRLRETEKGGLLCTLEGFAGGAHAEFSRDGKRVFLVRADRDALDVRVHETADGKEVSRMKLPGTPFFSPDGLLVVWKADDGWMRVADATTGKKLRRLRRRPPDVLGRRAEIEFSSDGEYLAVAQQLSNRDSDVGHPLRINAYHVRTGNEVGHFTVLPGGPDWVDCLALSPDGRVLATGQIREKTVRLWEVATGRERGRLSGHSDSVSGLAFSPDGNLLASASADATVLVWDLTEAPLVGMPRTSVRSDEERATAWTDLGSRDAARAWAAVGALKAAPDDGLALLRERLRPARPADPRATARLIADLDDDEFEVREKASKELGELCESVEPALREALEANPSAEVRQRVEALLEIVQNPTPPPNRLHELRALEALERIGTPAARDLLRTLADGAPAARLTQEAKTALERLAKR